ncbi:MAG: exodeoxyribonuclease VII small subunit [Vampirovibrionales bacterium]
MPRSSKSSNVESFSSANDRLEVILQRFRSDTLPLEDAIALFEEGVDALTVCQTTLQKARGTVEILLKRVSDSATGTPITEPFDE